MSSPYRDRARKLRRVRWGEWRRSGARKEMLTFRARVRRMLGLTP